MLINFSCQWKISQPGYYILKHQQFLRWIFIYSVFFMISKVKQHWIGFFITSLYSRQVFFFFFLENQKQVDLGAVGRIEIAAERLGDNVSHNGAGGRSTKGKLWVTRVLPVWASFNLTSEKNLILFFQISLKQYLVSKVKCHVHVFYCFVWNFREKNPRVKNNCEKIKKNLNIFAFAKNFLTSL